MNLFFHHFGQGKPLIILHGLFGMSDNWMSVAKSLSEHYSIWVPDLRNHGRSPQSKDWNYQIMASDIATLIEEHHINQPCVIGHSMGGKVAMQLGFNRPDLVDSLIIVDIAPKKYSPGEDHLKIIKALSEITLSKVQSRSEVNTLLIPYGLDQQVIQFILKNLVLEEGHYFWRFNFKDISEQINEIGKAIESNQPFVKPSLFIKGEFSNYILEKDKAEIHQLFPNSTLKTIAGAAHWIHSEKPEEIISTIKSFYQP